VIEGSEPVELLDAADHLIAREIQNAIDADA
jgi:hypothetical protein